MMYRSTSAVLLGLLLACGEEPGKRREHEEHREQAAARAAELELTSARADNLPPAGTPYIPPQCYTKTRDGEGRVHNPCFTCHADGDAPNYIRDGALQLGYDFGPPARVNPWTNLFVDRTAQVAAISDEQILTYVRSDNYRSSAGRPGLAERLRSSAGEWDADGDGRFSGFVPDIAFDFDEQGFDRTPDGGYTGFRAYAYFPLPGTFWPTNGSFGDALIRLPRAFRETADGTFDLAVYTVNLAVLEALITRRDVAIEPTDERTLGVDLDQNGRLTTARVVRYRWQPGAHNMRWAGQAGELLDQGKVHLAAGLFPEGTELAHSVRYLDVQAGRVKLAPRMKELRYMVKSGWLSYGALEVQATQEAAEKASSPDKTRLIVGSSEQGVSNGAGWRLQGFIEDAQGELRPQTLAEHGFCIGCHSGVGVTDDSVFSFGRKLTDQAFQRGWFHWTQRGLEGVAEPRRADGHGEYTFYLAQNGAGDELRQNDELLTRLFTSEGALRDDMAARVARDVSALLLPSPERAVALDKAYLTIVREQSFTRGRDALITAAQNVHRVLPDEELRTAVLEPISERRRMRPKRSRAARLEPGRSAPM
nr:hypothetical protein [uncultured bacterium]